jgi:mono/diheme cytochrome c family protein
MIKVLTAALVGTIIGIIVMVVVIALSGTDTSGASSVGLGSLPVSTFSASSSSGGSSTPPTSSGGSSGGSSSGGSASGDATNGKALFVSKTCSGCHADQPGAQSPFAAAPNLADLNASGALTEDTILTQIQNGGGPMPPNLASGQDAQDIAAYILTLGK